MCFDAEDVFVSLTCCFLAAQISLFVCLSEEKSPFLIFLIFLLCEFSFASSQQKQLSLKEDGVFVFFSRGGQTNNCCDDDDCD